MLHRDPTDKSATIVAYNRYFSCNPSQFSRESWDIFIRVTSAAILSSFVCHFYPVWPHTFVSPSADSRRAVVSYWRKYVHEVLVNRLGGLSLPRKSVVRLTDRPDMTLDTMDVKQEHNNNMSAIFIQNWVMPALKEIVSQTD